MSAYNKTGITSDDKQTLNDIFESELIRNGVDRENLSLLDPVSIAIQGFNTLVDNVSVLIQTIARESSLIHAQYPSSLMNQLVQHTDEVILAKPSKVWVFVRIPIYDVITYGDLVQNRTYEIVYTNKNTCEIDGLEFRPVEKEYIIRVTREPSGILTPKVYLDVSGVKNEVLVQRVTINGEDIIGFKIQMEQISIEEDNRTFSDDQLEKFIITGDDPISDIDIYYRDSLSDPWRPISKRLYFTRGAGEFLEYRILSNNKMSIEFKYVQGGFKPQVGGLLKIVKRCTTGRNIRYTGEAIVTNQDANVVHVSYEPVGVEYFESTGGELANTNIEYVRNQIIKLKGARKKIDTESDLKTYLLNYEGYSKFEPRLVSNDIKHRIFNVYTTLSFESKQGTQSRVFTVPTNSGNLTVDPKTLRSRNINGFTYYTFGSRDVIRSTQTRVIEFNTIDPNVDAMTDTPAEPVYIDPKDVNASSYVYHYISPFIYSYDNINNFVRVYQDAQYDKPYLSFSTYENINKQLPVRFINTSIRVNDFIDFKDDKRIDTKKIFQISALIRAEGDDYTPELGKNFKALLKFKDPFERDPNKYCYMSAQAIINEGDDRYDIIFPINTNRDIYGNYVEIEYTNELGKKSQTIIDVKSEFELELYYCDPDVVDPITHAALFYKVNTYRATVEVFKEVTKTLYVQTSVTLENLFKFMSIPMVKMSFYQKPRNRKHIVDEVENVYKFLDTAVYDELDEYSTRKTTIYDRLETLFNISIKFTKTYGLSKFLDVGNIVKTPIVNLQLSPTVFIRKSDSDFDESAIASQLNQDLITHDYFMTDFHMNKLVYNTMYKAGESVDFIQFTNLDKYPPDYLMVSRNNNKAANWDPPEVLSLEPVYDSESDNYYYNMKFIKS